MGIIEFVFEIWATKDKIKGVFTGLARCHGDILRHNNDYILFSNNSSFIWYHNIANTWYKGVVQILLIRASLGSVETGSSLLKVIPMKMTYYPDFFQTWHNWYSYTGHLKNAVKKWGHRACFRAVCTLFLVFFYRISREAFETSYLAKATKYYWKLEPACLSGL